MNQQLIAACPLQFPDETGLRITVLVAQLRGVGYFSSAVRKGVTGKRYSSHSEILVALVGEINGVDSKIVN